MFPSLSQINLDHIWSVKISVQCEDNMDWKEKLDGNSLTELLETEKLIVTKEPKSGFREEYGHYRADLTLESPVIKAKYRVFIRQNKEFPENFSIGCCFLGTHGEVAVIRFNGAHKRIVDDIDNHHCQAHIHVEQGFEDSMNSLDNAEVTLEYDDLCSAIRYAMNRLNILNYQSYFPNVDQMQIDLED